MAGSSLPSLLQTDDTGSFEGFYWEVMGHLGGVGQGGFLGKARDRDFEF